MTKSGRPLSKPPARTQAHCLASLPRLSCSHPSHRDSIQLGVGAVLFVEICREKADDFIMTGAFGPCDERAVAADFVVLNRLAARDDGSIEHSLVFDLASDLIRFLDDPINRRGRTCP